MKHIIKKLALLFVPVYLWFAFFVAFEPNNYFGIKKTASSSQPVARVRAYEQSPGTNLIIGDSRLAHFDMDLVDSLTGQSWQVTPRSNRIGMRLAGAQPLQRVRHDELPSEGTVNGAIQVPISGQPVLFLADHPLTGGYPVMAAVASHHLDLAAQIPVGCTIRFRVIAAA